MALAVEDFGGFAEPAPRIYFAAVFRHLVAGEKGTL